MLYCHHMCFVVSQGSWLFICFCGSCLEFWECLGEILGSLVRGWYFFGVFILDVGAQGNTRQVSVCIGVLKAPWGRVRGAEGFDLECVGSLNYIFGIFFQDFLLVFGSTVFPKFIEISADFLEFLAFFV